MGLKTAILTKFSEAVGLRKKELHEYGLDFLKDVALYPRIDGMREVIDVLEDKTKNIDEVVQLVNRAVHVVAVPYGGEGVFQQMIMYWEQIIANWYDIKGLRDTEKDVKLFSDKELDKLIKNFGWRDVIPYGMIIIDLSFKDKHVSALNIAMIQSVMSKDNRWKGHTDE